MPTAMVLRVDTAPADYNDILLADMADFYDSPTSLPNPFEQPLPDADKDLIMNDKTGHYKRIHDEIIKSHNNANVFMKNEK